MGRMQKAIEEYQTRKDKSKGTFKMSDLIEIMEISKGDSFKIMSNSLDAAYIIGYRTAKRETSQARKKSKEVKRASGSSL